MCVFVKAKVRLMSQVRWEAVLMQPVDVDVFTLLRTTHGSEASPGEAWAWVNYGPHLNQDGGGLWGEQGVCYTCEPCHCMSGAR